MLRKFPGNESFRIDIASLECLIFKATVMKKLLKALATFLGSFNF